jgi:UDP-N-acetylmuramate dehydrogenase
VLVKEQVPFAPLTTIGVGGPARYLIEASTTDAVREAVAFARARELPLFVLGGGSNLVVSDAGFPGVVLKITIGTVAQHAENGRMLFRVGAGVDWDAFVLTSLDANAAGLECLSGIPGTVGGTPVQNVGAYGQEVSESITQVQALEIASGRVQTFSTTDCNFAYRTSLFNSERRGEYIILYVSFSLEPNGRPKIIYADLKKLFAADTAPSLVQVREAVRTTRASKGMLLADDDPDSRSAGSFFKNPVVSDEKYREVCERAAQLGLAVPSYPALEQQRKLPAAWLVEHSGFPKGYQRGAVGISTKHALAIVNRGGATAADVIALKNEIQRGVRDRFGVELRPEPVFVGFKEEQLAAKNI